AALLAGMAWYTLQRCPEAKDISRWAPSRPARIVAQVVRSIGGGRTVACRARELLPSVGQGPARVGGLFVLRTSGSRDLHIGDVVAVQRPRLLPWRRQTNPYQHMHPRYWVRQRVWCRAVGGKLQVVRQSSRPALSDRAAGWREYLDKRLALAMPGRQAGIYARLLGAIVYGSSLADLPGTITDAYRRTGTIHVLVVSGSQVTLLVMILLLITGTRRYALRWWHVGLVVPLALLYAVLCGGEPSILRAAALSVVMIGALWGGRPYDIATALSLVAAVLVMAQPADLFRPGLQLTFAACVGVVAAVKLVEGPANMAAPRLVARLLRGLRFTLAGTAGAWVMTTPLLAYHFGAVAVVGNVANVVVVPMAAVALIVGLPAVLLAAFSPLSATGLLHLARLPLEASVTTTRAAAMLPGAYLQSLHASLALVALWYVAALAAYLLARFGGRTGKWIALAGGLSCAVVLLALMAVPRACRHVTITWFDVGEGLATVIETPERQFVLFDAGSRDVDLAGRRAANDVLLPYLAARGCRRLQAIVISHADTDHFNAVRRLSWMVQLDSVIVPPWGSGEQYDRLLADLRRRGVAVRVARGGASLDLGSARLTFLHPQPYACGGGPGDDNNNCLVAMLEAAGQRVLLSADLEVPGQRTLLRARGAQEVRAQVLQVPHHGRKSAFGPEFFEAVQPALAVVPAAPWWFGGEVDQRLTPWLSQRGATTMVTGVNGAVTAELTPRGVVWRAFVHPRRSQVLPPLQYGQVD
ncbi:MAG: ComEC/Rec2 family competence protein, partial [Armatimonadetes bacterium]|nr:ComEC/Rec2 family competence protein [Armatimonadota bacterium]